MHRVNRPVILFSALAVLLVLHLLFSPSSSQPSYKPSSASSRRNTSPAKNIYGSTAPKAVSSDGVEIDSRGYINYVPGKTLAHPLELLVERGKRLAAEQEAKIREVQTLEDAVDEYEREYGMKPPKGFDKWFRFTQSSSPPTIVSPALLPYAHNPLLSFLGLPTDIVRERVDEVRQKGEIFSFTFVPDGQGDEGTACSSEEDWYPEDWHTRGKGRVRVRGPASWLWRCNNTLTMLLPILPLMPDELFTQDPPVELAFSMSDGPRGMVHNTVRDRSESLGRAGKVWPKAQLYKAEQNMRWTYGWGWSCPEGTPLKTQNTDLVLNDLSPVQVPFGEKGAGSAPKSFIADFDMAANFCNNPDLMGLHHILLSEKHRAAVDLVPVVMTCRVMWNSDVLGVPLDGVHETVEYVPWEKKDIAKAFWRGTSTGLHHNKETPWRSSQRDRLHFFAHNTSTASTPILVDRTKSGGRLELEEWSVKELNEKWLDIGLSGGPAQCNQEDGTCDVMAKEIDFMDRVRKEDSVKYKFAVDVDGNGWSSRFRRLLASNNVVFKSTLYPEWFSAQLIPWYHYVPLKLDYSDMHDIMAFFNGSPDGTAPGRDDLAKEIAANGLKFTQERWRMEDMQSFMYLLVLEYWRVWSDDREANAYTI
ncbi:hypothetical protein EHS25_009610 [Saitozyma podzolica]|uniref:Glycosyl transferase CAP10 domain-containing protein n=1 Tax=Saitozyma podzolica TaxID=1890683 RepID=A0A427YJR3_9TREE|nr:hypothetical protein EHS25_009610 [Saitozyma podzolica]